MKPADVPTIATQLGCSPQHVRNLIRDGVLTNVGSRKRFMIDPEEVSKALRAGVIYPRPRARIPRAIW